MVIILDSIFICVGILAENGFTSTVLRNCKEENVPAIPPEPDPPVAKNSGQTKSLEIVSTLSLRHINDSWQDATKYNMDSRVICNSAMTDDAWQDVMKYVLHLVNIYSDELSNLDIDIFFQS